MIDVMLCFYLKINRKSRDACNTPPGGVEQNSTYKIVKLIHAQLDQPTPVFRYQPRSTCDFI